MMPSYRTLTADQRAEIVAQLATLGESEREQIMREAGIASFDASLKRATAIVSKWPKWKQNILEQSAQPSGPSRVPLTRDEEINRALVAQRRYT